MASLAIYLATLMALISEGRVDLVCSCRPCHYRKFRYFVYLFPVVTLLYCRREREMQKRIEHQNVRLTHLTQELESTKEAQRIVLDTKESVMRSLLKQNSHITQEVGLNLN